MFRSVKNWLTLLIVALVALAMLVAWVYVVPPLQGRLTDQKLADARAQRAPDQRDGDAHVARATTPAPAS